MEKIKKIPMRQCMGCNEHKPKSELLRVVRDPEGNISLDFKGKKSGRGAYLCFDVGPNSLPNFHPCSGISFIQPIKVALSPIW